MKVEERQVVKMRKTFYKFLSLFKHRIAVVSVAMIVLFSILVVHVFNLQIIQGDEYKQKLATSIEKTVSTSASRGRIFDRNGVLLAYDELVYSVVISDSGKYTNKQEKHKSINSSILKALKIIKENGDSYSNTFGISDNGDGTYSYNNSEEARPGFLRDCYGVATIDELTDEQLNTSADDLIKYLVETYQVDTEDVSSEDLIELLYLRTNLTANSYTRYKEITISEEVSDETVAAISESEIDLNGITVGKSYVRRYNDSKYYASFMGYTGVVSTEQLAELVEQDSSYENNDVVGKSGIEEAFELELSGTKGEKNVYLDTVGRITQVISETDAVTGNDVYLTIDAEIQKKTYDLLEDKLTQIILEHLKESGEKYIYKNDSLSNVYILMPEVTYAYLANGLVSYNKLQNPTTDLEKQVYNKYLPRFNNRLEWVKSEISDSNGTKYQNLTDEEKVYIWRAYELLKDNKVIDSNKIDSENEVYQQWNNGEGLSFREFIESAITNGWIDISPITDEKYTDMEQIYTKIIDYCIQNLEKDKTFSLNVYQYLIEDGSISAREMYLLAYDQGNLDKNDSLYTSLSAGTISNMDYITSALSQKIITPGTLGITPSSGGAVVEDPNNGQILALVSYPGYDNNKFSGSIDSDYYNMLNDNAAKPLLNWATQAQTMPGSIFKACTAIASLDKGITTADRLVNCTGMFSEVTPSPRCWIYPGAHGNETVATALRDSCNVYFYTMGYELAKSKDGKYDSKYGTDILQEYAENLGLATTTGIEIAESVPKASDTNAIASAIGQGTAQYSCLNISRYISTIAMNGKCYNTTLLLKVTDHDGNTIYEKEPELVSEMPEVSQSTWDTVHDGLIQAVKSYKMFKGLNLSVAGKTGTSQVDSKHMDNGTFISYAPYDSPEIAVSIEIPNGYTSNYNAEMAASLYQWYFNDFKNNNNDNNQ